MNRETRFHPLGHRLFFLFWIVLFLPVTGAAQPFPAGFLPNQYLHQVWRAEDGLPNPAVRAILQCRTGYLWLGTDEGLSRFDGVRFREMEQHTGGARMDRWLVALAETRDGSIWTSSINGGITRIQNGQLTRYSTKDGLLHDYVLSLFEDRSGNFWIGTAGGLSRFHQGKFINYTNQPGLFVEAVRAITEDSEGALWVGTAVGLSRLKDGEFTAFTTENLLVNNAVMSLCADKAGGLWIGTSGGLTHFFQGQRTHYTPQEGLLHRTVRSLYEDADGRIWIGTQGGVQVCANGQIQPVTITETSALDFEGITFVYSICQDREANVWIGSNIGLNRLKTQKFKPLTTHEGLPHNLTTLVYEDRENTLWIGTYGGGLCRQMPDKLLHLNSSNGLSSDYILALHEDREGAFWIGTEGMGLTRLKNGTFDHYRSEDVRANTIRVIFEDSKGNLWLGSNAGAHRFVNGRFVQEEKIPRSAIKAIVEDRQGNVWFGTKNGLARLANGEIKVFKLDHGLLSEAISAIFEDSTGALWVATEAGGLNRLLKYDRFASTPQSFRERVLHILEDTQGRLWFSTRNGIFAVAQNELEAMVRGKTPSAHFLVYGKKDGMKRAQCNGIAQPAGWKTRTGTIVFPTMYGAVSFDPTQLTSNLVPPPVVIERITVNGQPFPPENRLRFPPGRGLLEIEFTGLSFQAPERVKFKYRLEGFDTHWEDAGTRRMARYIGLPPGDYRVKVKACNNDGVWNETGAAFAFVQMPHFYQTYSFYFLCALVVFGAALGIHRIRVTRLQNREKLLAEQVEKRTARLQEMIKSMESFNYSIAHDLRAPIRAIRGLTQALVEDYKPSLDAVGCDYATRIEQAVDRMDQLIQDLLTYGQLSHKDIPIEPVDPERILKKVLQSLGPEINDSHAAVDFPKSFPAVLANETILEQVFLNLIGNGLKFVPKGIPPRLKIHTEDSGTKIKITVEDNGIGIEPSHHERIFRIFERLHSNGHYPGTGIGLAIVHRGIERLNGRVGVESQPNVGSRFWFELPKAP